MTQWSIDLGSFDDAMGKLETLIDLGTFDDAMGKLETAPWPDGEIGSPRPLILVKWFNTTSMLMGLKF